MTTTHHLAPMQLPINTPHRFYRGGERILAFRGLPVPDGFDGHRPEDWLASTTHPFAEGGGEGVLVLELQEPTDLSVMLEHARFGLEEAHAFLGLRRDAALASVDRGPLRPEAVEAQRRRWTDVIGAGSALPEAATDFFRAQVVRSTGPSAPPGATDTVTVEAAYAVTVVVAGRGNLATGTGDGTDGSSMEIAKGDVLLVPHGAGEVRVMGDVTVIRCMPPDGTPAG